MNFLFISIPVALLLLACPLMMFGMPIVMWVTSRIKGEKKPLSMSCMPGMSGDAMQSPGAGSDAALQGRVVQLEAEVSALRAQLQDGAHVERSQQ